MHAMLAYKFVASTSMAVTRRRRVCSSSTLLGRDTNTNTINSEMEKRSKQEVRRAEAAIKRQKMLEKQQRENDKVKDRLDLIRQMKGDGVVSASNPGAKRGQSNAPSLFFSTGPAL